MISSAAVQCKQTRRVYVCLSPSSNVRRKSDRCRAGWHAVCAPQCVHAGVCVCDVPCQLRWSAPVLPPGSFPAGSSLP